MHPSRSTLSVLSLYVDDLQIIYRRSDLRIIETNLQQCLNKMQEWTRKK